VIPDPAALQTFLASPLGQTAADTGLQLLISGGTALLRRHAKGNPVKMAVVRTCHEFDNPRGLARALQVWSKDPRVAKSASEYRKANPTCVDLDALAAVLVESVGYEYSQHLNWPRPEVIVRAFLVQLFWTAKDAPEWVPALDERTESRHAEVRNGFAQLEAGQDRILAAVLERNRTSLPKMPRTRLPRSSGAESIGKVYARAKRLHEELRFKSAYELFLAVVDASPDAARRSAALTYAGRCAYRLGDKSTAARHHNHAARLQLHTEKRVAYRVRALIWQGKNDAALKTLTPLLARAPNKGAYRALEAEAYVELGKPAAATAVFLDDNGKLRAGNWKRSRTVCYVLSYVLLRNGRPAEALKWEFRGTQ
jgi:tetratricopeptide (TPR) repeat protein